MKSQNKIIFVINNYEFYLTHRFNLLKHLAKENDVHLITNTAGFKIDSKNIYHLDIGRKSMNIFKNLKTSLELSSLVKKIDPTHIFFISFKPIALGVIPSLFSKAKKYLIFSGLGYSFINNSFKARIARIAINIALRIFSILGSKFIFQNPDDKELINKSGFISSHIFIFAVLAKIPKILFFCSLFSTLVYIFDHHNLQSTNPHLSIW